jgi:hypothetical protein
MNNSVSGSQLWFSFPGDSSSVTIALSKKISIGSIQKFEVYSGNCSSLVFKDSSRVQSDSLLACSLTGIVSGNTYFIKVIKTGTDTSIFDICSFNALETAFPACGTSCNQSVANPSFENNAYTLNPIEPFGCNRVDCWKASHGNPQIGSTGGGSAGSYYATMWAKTNSGEGIFTNVNVTSGKIYILDYYLRRSSVTPPTSAVDNFYIKLTSGTITAMPCPTPTSTSPPAVTSQTIGTNTFIINNTWQRHTKCFTASGNYNKLFLYPMTAANIYQWVDVDSVTLTEFKVDAGPDQTLICTTGTLGNSSCPPIPGATYNWSPSTGLSSTTTPTTTLTTTSTSPASMMYILTATVATCTTRDTVIISSPPLEVTADTVYTCLGQQVNLTATGAVSYQWSTGATSATILVNPTSNTSYTVTGTTNGCTDVAVGWVIVRPLPNVNVPSNFSICHGNSTAASNFTSSVAGTTYSWTNSNTAIGLAASGSGNVPSFVATNTTSSAISAVITVTPGANGCTGTASTYTITVNPSPTISVSPSSATITFGGSVGLTASGASTYSWSPATGLSCTSCANPTASPLNTTTYTVTGTSAAGCTSTATVTITVNLPQCGITIPQSNVITGPVTVSTQFGSATGTTGNYSLSGTLTVNQNFFFSACNIIMAPGAKIVVTGPNVLTITDKTHIFSCSDQWDYIKVETGAKVIMQGQCLVEDAKKALTIDNGAQTCVVEETTFNRNLCSIEIPANTSATSVLDLKKSVFTSRHIPSFASVGSNPSPSLVWSNITGGTPYTTANCRTPNSNEKAAYGINATDVNVLNIGSGALSASVNSFDELQCAIRLTRSNAVIHNNRFRNLVSPTTCTGCANLPGYGIMATGTSTGTNSITIGGSGTLYELNNFYNVHRSGFIQYYQTQLIEKNIINNTSSVASPSVGAGNLGFWVLPSSNNTVTVTDNNINNCITGITLNRSMAFAVSTVSVSISENLVAANSSGSCQNGILVADYSGSYSNTPTTSEIRDNVVNECETGISLSSVKQPLIVETNSILCRYASSGSLNGIKAAGCVGVTIKTNHTKYNSTAGGVFPSGNLTAYGIYLQSSTNMLVKCNLIEDAGRSMVFEGTCTSPMPLGYGIRQNTMRRAQDGFVLLNAGVIGQQGIVSPMLNVPSNNYWDLSTTPNFSRSHTYTASTANANNTSKLYMNNITTGASTTMPTNNQSDVPDPYISGTGPAFGLNILGGSAASCDTPPQFTGGGEEESQMVEVMEAENENLSIELEQMIAGTDQLVYSEESNWTQRKYVFDQMSQQEQLNSTAELSNFMSDPSLNYSSINAVEEMIMNGEYSNANLLNDGILPINTIETNITVFNNLYLKKHLTETYEYSVEEMDVLLQIAEQCPLSGGPAVYQSRNFIMALTSLVSNFSDDCNTAGKAPSLQRNHSNYAFKLYPNPSNAFVTVEYKSLTNEKGSLSIYDLTGKLKVEYVLDQSGKMSFDLAFLNNGIYFYQVMINHTLQQADKLVIIK